MISAMTNKIYSIDIKVRDYELDAEGIVNVAIKNGLNINDIIVTDVTPVFWKNLSTLLYNGKVSQSYIYRYPNYKITNKKTLINPNKNVFHIISFLLL